MRKLPCPFLLPHSLQTILIYLFILHNKIKLLLMIGNVTETGSANHCANCGVSDAQLKQKLGCVASNYYCNEFNINA